MITKIKKLTTEFNSEVKKLKQQILARKATLEDIIELKKVYLSKILWVIIDRIIR
jgi:hypothetical protein